MKKPSLGIIIFFLLQSLHAQHIDLLIKGGHVIDAKSKTDGIFDVAVSGGKVTAIASHINATHAGKIIDAHGLYVVPGLIDMHTHVFYGPDASRQFCNGAKSVLPDAFAFSTGVTTVVDAGSSGWKDFPVFKTQVIDLSKTRILVFLNIVGAGMRGPVYEQDTNDMDGSKTAMMAMLYPKYIVGIKLAHFIGPEWKPVNEAIKAGRMADIPVMIDFGRSTTPLPIRELFLDHMSAGDMFTHCFAELNGREFIVDTLKKKIKPFVWEAKRKGICFDLGYGEISFSFSQAVPSIRENFYPNTISTDIHATTKNKIKNMPEIMSEFFAMGMSFQNLIKSVTWEPAQEIHHKELGNISVGSVADITILKVMDKKMIFYDHSGHSFTGKKEVKSVITIKGGEIVYQAD